MAKTIQFEEFGGGMRGEHCIACEEMLADALDESLGEVDQAWFERHVQSCAGCSAMLADAQRGAAWLELLKTERPEPSARLVERILAETTGGAEVPMGQSAYAPSMVPSLVPVAAPGVGNLLAFRPRAAKWMFEPRLAMTAAMAFFSMALTLNLAGVKLNDLRVSDLKPENLKRSYYETNTQVVRYFDNLRLVRVMESRVDDLRQTQLDDAAQEPRRVRPQAEPDATPQAMPEKRRHRAEPGPGVSRGELPGVQPGRPRVNAVDDKVRRDDAAGTTRREGGLA